MLKREDRSETFADDTGISIEHNNRYLIESNTNTVVEQINVKIIYFHVPQVNDTL